MMMRCGGNPGEVAPGEEEPINDSLNRTKDVNSEAGYLPGIYLVQTATLTPWRNGKEFLYYTYMTGEALIPRDRLSSL